MSAVVDPVVIVSAQRTAIGSFQGRLATLTAPQLGAAAIAAAVDKAGLSPDDIDEALIGCVLSAGVGQAPARQAALGAGLSVSVPSTTVSKVCGSGLKAVALANDQILADAAGVIVAGGMESMTNAPHLLKKARSGYRLGHGELVDHMFFDGLQNAYDNQLMGHFAELCAEKYGYSRAHQDEYACGSVERAQAAVLEGRFASEICPVRVLDKTSETLFEQDETPLQCSIDKIPKLKPAFRKNGGTVTAANSSSISDGAAALVLMNASKANRRGIAPLARIVGYASFAHEPEWFTTAPVHAIDRLRRRIGWDLETVDLFEINEAFAVVTMVTIDQLKIDPARVNVNGGACALGHPIGASGARILVTLIHALRARGLHRGIAAICIGGGEALAMAVDVI